jgi:hypothetical protein
MLESKSRLSLLVRIQGTSGLSDEQIYSKAESLRREIIESRLADRVERAKSAIGLPDGAKAAEALTLGALLLAVAPTVVQDIGEVIRGWLSRNRNLRIAISLPDKTTLELEACSPADFERVFGQITGIITPLEPKHD